MGKGHASGAKARRLFCCICGTTEVVPFQNSEFFRSLLIRSLLSCSHSVFLTGIGGTGLLPYSANPSR